MKILLSLLIAIVLIPSFANAGLVTTWAFSSPGNTDGWVPISTGNPASPSVNGLTTNATGSLEGVARGNDPQLRNTATQTLSAGVMSWDRIEFRVRETEETTNNVVSAFNQTGLIVALKDGTNPTRTYNAGFTGVSSGNGFFTVTLNISDFGFSSFDSFRFDPIGGAAGNSNSQTDLNTFEIDYISVFESAAVPEPSSMAMFAIGCICAAGRRRKRNVS